MNGNLRIDKVVGETEFKRLFYAPILWLGHIISDLFTKAGVPLPGSCLLRTLQFGSLGEKERTLGQVVEYMYYEGYDMRHLLTMSISKIVIDLVIRIYFILIAKQEESKSFLISENEYIQVQNKKKLHKLLFIAYSVASCGNITKVVTFQGNPTAINAVVWYSFIKESIAMASMKINRQEKTVENIIEDRHIIDENFDYLYSILRKD